MGSEFVLAAEFVEVELAESWNREAFEFLYVLTK
jgi:hypothetical protein